MRFPLNIIAHIIIYPPVYNTLSNNNIPIIIRSAYTYRKFKKISLYLYILPRPFELSYLENQNFAITLAQVNTHPRDARRVQFRIRARSNADRPHLHPVTNH